MDAQLNDDQIDILKICKNNNDNFSDKDMVNGDAMDIDGTPEKLTLVGWSKDEKYELLCALKAFGFENMDKVQQRLPSKTSEEINHAIAYYKQCALKHLPERQKRDKYSIRLRPRKPLATWAKFLTDKLNYSELQTETSTAVRLIADLEALPQPICTEKVDFRKIYHLLANAMEGKVIPEDDILVSDVLTQCLLETALLSRTFIRGTSFKQVIHNIDLSEKEIRGFPKPTEDSELATLRHLATQRPYNPFNIPEEFLKSSMHVVKSPEK